MDLNFIATYLNTPYALGIFLCGFFIGFVSCYYFIKFFGTRERIDTFICKIGDDENRFNADINVFAIFKGAKLKQVRCPYAKKLKCTLSNKPCFINNF
ncbi:TPA: hypothetical protein ACVZ4X_002133 [Campylobacter jejuni]